MVIGIKHIARLNDRLGFITWIRPATMRKLVSPADRHFEFGIAIGQGRQIT